jgi:ATP-binding cassette subfamily C protein LapB
MNSTDTPATTASPGTATLGRIVDRAARLVGQRVERSRLDDLDRLPAPALVDAAQAATLFAQAWGLAGLEGEPAPLPSPTPANLPFVARVASRWLLVSGRAADGGWRAEDHDGLPVPLPTLEGASFLALPRPRRVAAGRPSALGLVRRALWARK